MSELSFPANGTQLLPAELPRPALPHISRRGFLRLTGSAAGAAAAAYLLTNIDTAADFVGELAGTGADQLFPTESPFAGTPPLLEPRTDNTPSVAPRPHAEPTDITIRSTRQNGATTLELPASPSLWAEHTNTSVPRSGLVSSGTGIVTTAEGPLRGKQEYCMFFKADHALLALGYEGGMYTYEPRLGQDKKSGEWVRIVTQHPDSADPSPVTAATGWGEVEAAAPGTTLIEQVVQGTQTLQEAGYQPWAAVLPSTRMPGAKHIELTTVNCARDLGEIVENTESKNYFITERGDIVDIKHLQAKAAETLNLFMQLYYQRLTSEPHPSAIIRYAEGSQGRFTFAVDSVSLQGDNIFDATFAIMSAESVLMEGVSQRYASDKLPFVEDIDPSIGGLNPEDLFTNSLGITGMLSLIKQPETLRYLERFLQTLHSKQLAPNLQEALEANSRDMQTIMAQYVVSQTAQGLGVRTVKDPTTVTLPRGIYPLLPTKITDADAAHPTRINTQALGIHPSELNTRFRALHIPVMQTTAERVLGKLGF